MNEPAVAWAEQLPLLPASKPRFRSPGPKEQPPCRWVVAPREDYFEEPSSAVPWYCSLAGSSISQDFLAVQSAAELNFAQAAPLGSAVAQEAAP